MNPSLTDWELYLRPDVAPAPAPRARQLAALARGEWRALIRNKVALVNSVITPLLIGVAFLGIRRDGVELGTVFVVMVTSMAILMVVYYTLVTAVVARRESLLLKRLRSGEAGDGTILSGIATPFVVITMIQFVLALVLAIFAFEATLTPMLALAAVAVLLTAIVFAALGVVSTRFTQTVEHAQITTLPVIIVPLMLSGLMVPLAMLPTPLRVIAELLPLTPMVELLHLGIGGVTVGGAAAGLVDAARPMLVLVCWVVLSLRLVGRTMIWESRS